MTSPENIKPFVIGIIVLLIVYMVLRARTERIKRHRSDNPSRFRRKL